ncbi:MAG TPA: hypothetical protein VKA43_13910, partial [Gammaproteobacteria bacterium]|nr:hypothetical protein [Gammaproteobacteria bacterium]
MVVTVNCPSFGQLEGLRESFRCLDQEQPVPRFVIAEPATHELSNVTLLHIAHGQRIALAAAAVS